MKSGKVEKMLLLEQTGELTAKQRSRLVRELAVSGNARRMRDELNTISKAVVKKDTAPDPWAARRIDSRLRAEKTPARTVVRLLKPVFALAACLLLAAGLWNFHGKQNPSVSDVVSVTTELNVWNDPLEEDMSKLENLILAISGDPLDIMEI
jgi:hypothetical protein